MYDYEPAEVSRRRAAAIERLADDLRVQRGEDLGSVLKALLEPNTWSGIEPAPGREFASTQAPVRRPGAPPTPPTPIVARAGGEREPSPAPVPLRPVPSPPPEPEKEPEDPPPAPAGRGGGPRARRRGRAGARHAQPTGAALRGGPRAPCAERGPHARGAGRCRARGRGRPDGRHAPRRWRLRWPPEPERGRWHAQLRARQGGPLEAPFASDPQTSSCYSTAYVQQSTVLFREPGGEPRLRITKRTEWGSPRVLGVVGQRGDWLGVQASELKNGEVAWIPRERARVDCVRWSVHADLSRRQLYVRKDGHTVRKFRIAIGSPGHTTPLGRFSVTDKLHVTDKDSPYGCCVLALTGHQTHLPEDWPGGDRLAVHATADLGSIGKPVSLGCMRVTSEEARWLISKMPLGTPVFVSA